MPQYSQSNFGVLAPQSVKHGSSFITEYITENVHNKLSKTNRTDSRKTERNEYTSLTVPEVKAMKPVEFKQFINNITEVRLVCLKHNLGNEEEQTLKETSFLQRSVTNTPNKETT